MAEDKPTGPRHAAQVPIFVDHRGARLRHARATAWLIGLGAAMIAVALGVAFGVNLAGVTPDWSLKPAPSQPGRAPATVPPATLQSGTPLPSASPDRPTTPSSVAPTHVPTTAPIRSTTRPPTPGPTRATARPSRTQPSQANRPSVRPTPPGKSAKP